MSKINSIDALILDIPTRRPHVLAMATMETQSIVLVIIQRSDGAIGVGEATTIGGLAYGPESPESIKLTIDTYITPMLLGADANQPSRLMAELNKTIVGNQFAKCGIEIALLDALGKSRNMPVSELFGGRVTSTLPIAWTLASGETSRDIAEGEEMLSTRSHNIFKLKIGKRSVLDDCAHAAAIARVFEGRASVRVDVNQRWSRTQAFEGARRLHDAGVELLEQPLAATDLAGMRQLVSQAILPIMADESLTGPKSALEILRNDAADVFSVKISQSGGLTPARDVMAIGRAGNIELYGGTMLEGPISSVASAHLFATCAPLEWGTELFGPLLLAREILAEPLTYKDFGMVLPDGPGLGIRLDYERVRALTREGQNLSRALETLASF